MKVTEFTYEQTPNGWKKTVTKGDIDTPLTRAVEAEAEANPGRIICGVEKETISKDGQASVSEILCVGPLDGM